MDNENLQTKKVSKRDQKGIKNHAHPIKFLDPGWLPTLVFSSLV